MWENRNEVISENRKLHRAGTKKRQFKKTNDTQMKSENKTTETAASVTDFLNAVENEQKRLDSFQLVEIMREISGNEPKMWGPTIVGFGSYHYQYDSGREGDAPLIGFSPRKDAISLYVYAQGSDADVLLEKLGRYKKAVACIYVKKLSDIDRLVLKELAKEAIRFTSEKFTRTS